MAFKSSFDCFPILNASSWLQVDSLPLTIISNHMVLTWDRWWYDHLERMVWVEGESRIIVLRAAHMKVGLLPLLLLLLLLLPRRLPFQPQVFSHTCPNTEASVDERNLIGSGRLLLLLATLIAVQSCGSELKWHRTWFLTSTVLYLSRIRIRKTLLSPVKSSGNLSLTCSQMCVEKKKINKYLSIYIWCNYHILIIFHPVPTMFPCGLLQLCI